MLSALLIFVCNNIVNKIPFHFLRLLFYRKVMKFEIGKDSSILMGVRFYGSKNFIIGDNSVINDYCRIDNRGLITIGNNVSISSESYLITAYHDVYSTGFENVIKPIIVEDFVFLGIRCTILPGVKLSTGAVAAASSTIIKSVPEFVIIGGNPAIQIGKRPNKLNYKINFRPLYQ
jgi:maltose O-acetyltransferase